MKVGFIGNYQSGYVGEISDESHLAREIETLGNKVYRIPRDEWREYVIEGFPQNKYKNVPEIDRLDIVIFAKWAGFYDGSFIVKAREKYKCPCFLWVWDWMQGEPWHMEAVKAADLYIANDVFSGKYDILKYETPNYVNNLYYFPFDVADNNFPRFHLKDKTIEVAFFGSWINQGHRQEWLKQINHAIPVTVFSWNYQEWPKEFSAYPPVYGHDFSRKVAESKICLGFSVDPYTWGYWSNRTGKTLLAGGFLLYEYAPGMELFLRDGVEYFSSVDEAVFKIGFYTVNHLARNGIANRGYDLAQERFSSAARVKDLLILVDRFIHKGEAVWKM